LRPIFGANHAHAALGAARDRIQVPGTHALHRGLARLRLEGDESRDQRVLPVAVQAGKHGVIADRFFPAGFGEGGLDSHKCVLGIEASASKRPGDPCGSVGARLAIGLGESCPFLETVLVSGPFGGPLAQLVEVDRCDGIRLKNCRYVEVEKFYSIGKQADHLVEAGFEMIAMRGGAAVAGNPEDALDVEMRIEAGQFLDRSRDLVDQGKHRLFSLPGIAKQARHEAGLGGKFGAQRLACEEGVDQSEAAGRLLWQGHRQKAREGASCFPVGRARPVEPQCGAFCERRAKPRGRRGPGRWMENMKIRRLLRLPFDAESGGLRDPARRRGLGDRGGDIFASARQPRYGLEDRGERLDAGKGWIGRRPRAPPLCRPVLAAAEFGAGNRPVAGRSAAPRNTNGC
jgi:hypothetical protein